MSYFNGTACFSPRVPSWIETVWSMNGGSVMPSRALRPQFGETAGRVSGVDWLFGLDEADPWVKTWRANSNVVFHAAYVLQVVSRRVDQTLVPMRDYILGSAGPQTQRFSPNDLPGPKRDGLSLRPSPPARATVISRPSSRVSAPRPPTIGTLVEKPAYMRMPPKITTPSIGLAEQSTLVDLSLPHDNSGQSKKDHALTIFPEIPSVSVSTTKAPLWQDCPRIDLIALVREKQKAKKLQKKKLSVPLFLREPHHRTGPRGLGPEKHRYTVSNARGSRHEPINNRAHRSPVPKKQYGSAAHIPRIFKPILPPDCVSVFDGIGYQQPERDGIGTLTSKHPKVLALAAFTSTNHGPAVPS